MFWVYAGRCLHDFPGSKCVQGASDFERIISVNLHIVQTPCHSYDVFTELFKITDLLVACFSVSLKVAFLRELLAALVAQVGSDTHMALEVVQEVAALLEDLVTARELTQKVSIDALCVRIHDSDRGVIILGNGLEGSHAD